MPKRLSHPGALGMSILKVVTWLHDTNIGEVLPYITFSLQDMQFGTQLGEYKILDMRDIILSSPKKQLKSC